MKHLPFWHFNDKYIIFYKYTYIDIYSYTDFGTKYDCCLINSSNFVLKSSLLMGSPNLQTGFLTTYST